MTADGSEAEYQRAYALQDAGCFAEAAQIYTVLARKNLTLKVALGLGRCMSRLGRRADAEHWLGVVVRNRPKSAEAHRLVGVALAASGKIKAAEQAYRTALKLEPGNGPAKLALAALYLSVGRWAEGWPLLEARAALHPDVVPPVKVDFPEWLGEPLDGRSILVWVEQGFGDQIQFSRFANVLKARGASRVTLACRPALAHLFTTIAGVDSVVPVALGGKTVVQTHDCWSRYFSLPFRLGVTLETLPAEPYLNAPADRMDRWKDARGVGLVWRASPTGLNAATKSLDDAAAQRLLGRGAVSLHPEDTGAADFADTAAIIQRLDLVISIDTAVAHLAGAMGKPCWILVPYIDPDWRWLRDREDCPWYPATRLYRQEAPGTWDGVVQRLLADWPA